MRIYYIIIKRKDRFNTLISALVYNDLQRLLSENKIVNVYAKPGMGKSYFVSGFSDFLLQHNITYTVKKFNSRYSINEFLNNGLYQHDFQKTLYIFDLAEIVTNTTLSLFVKYIFDSPYYQAIIISRSPLYTFNNIGYYPLKRIDENNFKILCLSLKTDNSIMDLDSLYKLTNGNPYILDTLFFKFDLDNGATIDTKCNSIIPVSAPISIENKIHISQINKQLISQIIKNPYKLYDLSPRQFEYFVANMLEELGYGVTITPPTRDGGKDILVASNSVFGDFLFYVECKKYAPHNHVGIDVIQRLYGTISAEKITGGIVATTSYFTQSAKEFIIENKLSHQLMLHDFNDICKLLHNLKL